MAKRIHQVKVIAGKFKGRLLEYPPRAVRPTMQRVKSSIFESLGPSIKGTVFMDLYCAAGSMGIEALSRGADFAYFVDTDRRALKTLQRNLEICGVPAHSYRIHRMDVLAFLEGGSVEEVGPDLVYVDPPYADTDFRLLLELLDKIAYSREAVVIVEHPSSVRVDPGVQLASDRVKSFGQTAVSFFSLASGGAGK